MPIRRMGLSVTKKMEDPAVALGSSIYTSACDLLFFWHFAVLPNPLFDSARQVTWCPLKITYDEPRAAQAATYFSTTSFFSLLFFSLLLFSLFSLLLSW